MSQVSSYWAPPGKLECRHQVLFHSPGKNRKTQFGFSSRLKLGPRCFSQSPCRNTPECKGLQILQSHALESKIPPNPSLYPEYAKFQHFFSTKAAPFTLITILFCYLLGSNLDKLPEVSFNINDVQPRWRDFVNSKIIPLILQGLLQWLCAQEGKHDREHPANCTSPEDGWILHTEEMQITHAEFQRQWYHSFKSLQHARITAI